MSFYQWNGKLSQAIPVDEQPPPPPANLWQFTPDGDSGEWSIVNQAQLQRVARASSTQANGTAYILGGFEDYWTSTAYYDSTTLRHQVGGILSYEFGSQTWTNHSIERFAPTGWSLDASIHYLQGLGRKGLLLAIGGSTAPSGGRRQGEEILNPFDDVTLYDAPAGEWYNQSTTGDIPAHRAEACSWYFWGL
jgi:hypothetical protein